MSRRILKDSWAAPAMTRSTGGPGNDTLIGGLGADVMGGGPGIDTVDYSARTATW